MFGPASRSHAARSINLVNRPQSLCDGKRGSNATVMYSVVLFVIINTFGLEFENGVLNMKNKIK